MIRPIGRSILGPDNSIWSGWSATYGRYGGGVSRINTVKNEVSFWYDMIPDQAYCSLAAGKAHIYATTNGTTFGLNAKEDAFFLLKLDLKGNIVWKEQFAVGQFPAQLAVTCGYLFISLRDFNDGKRYIRVYQEETMELNDTLVFGIMDTGHWENIIDCIGSYDENTLLLFAGKKAILMDACSFEIVNSHEIPTPVEVYTMTSDKNIYISKGAELFRFHFGMSKFKKTNEMCPAEECSGCR